jgi:hypothetical protein
MTTFLIDNFNEGNVEFFLNGKAPKPPISLTEEVSGVIGGVRDVLFELISAPDRTCAGELYILSDGLDCLTVHNRNKSSNSTATLKYGSATAPLNLSVTPGRFVFNVTSVAGQPTISLSINGSAFKSKSASTLANVSFPSRLFGDIAVINTIVLKISGQPDYDIELDNFSYQTTEVL